METTVSPEVLLRALRKTTMAIEGLGLKAVAIGAIGRRAWGAKTEPQAVELLLPTTEAQREQILSAARGEGLQQTPGGSPLSMRYTDTRLGGSAAVELVEAAGPLHKKLIERAQQGAVLQSPMLLASVEDLILLGCSSELPAERAGVIELLRSNAARLDAAYVKKEAEANGIFDRLKSAWQEAKAQG